jgi:hypothetical protein
MLSFGHGDGYEPDQVDDDGDELGGMWMEAALSGVCGAGFALVVNPDAPGCNGSLLTIMPSWRIIMDGKRRSN